MDQAAAELDRLRADRCDHGCGAIKSYPNGCPGCGAPNCCQSCCDLQNARDELDRLRAGALGDIYAEREKQRAKWGDGHDDGHSREELAQHAGALLYLDESGDDWCLLEKPWTRREQLVVAAALIAAEIDRMDREHPQ